MKERDEILPEVLNKIQLLARKYQNLKDKQQQSDNSLKALKTENDTLKNELETLRQQNLILKASVSSLDAGDKKDLERRLNQYIKSIDACIDIIGK